MTLCARPVPWEELVAYWAGDAADEEALEEHLMGCAACSAASAGVAAITEALRTLLPAVVTRAGLEALRAKGVRVREQALAPGDRLDAHFTADLDLLVFRLGGLDLHRAARVDLEVRAKETGALLTAVAAAPFEREEGAVLLLCQRHFAALPPLIVAELRVHDAGGGEREVSYTIDHRFEPR